MARTAERYISYVLREPKAKVSTPIIGLVRFNNNQIKIHTGFKVHPSHWSKALQKVKNVVDATEKDKINTYLENLSDAVESIINDLKMNRIELTGEIIRSRIKEYQQPTKSNDKPTTLIQFAQYYIETAPTRLVRSKGMRAGRVISPSTIQRYKTTLKGLIEFETNYSRTFSFENIDATFYKNFTEWLTARDYATNNVSKYIENVKGFMSAAVDEGLTSNLAFKRFSNLREDADNIYLTELELERIYKLDLSTVKRLERVRDLFIFASWTGLRFSDFSTLQPEHIQIDEKGNKYLNLKQRKTGGRVVIPIEHTAVTELLEKYDNRLPTGITNQRTNDYLKEIGKLAEINERVLKHITKGGKEVVKTSNGYSTVGTSSGVEKWELITTHTGRRSFATNMFKRGMPVYYIMKLTGHRKEAEFYKYIKVDKEETTDAIRSYFR